MALLLDKDVIVWNVGLRAMPCEYPNNIFLDGASKLIDLIGFLCACDTNAVASV
jgi:hypothetical protein